MRVGITSEARSFALERGAVLYVRTRGSRHCNRGLTLLEVSTAGPDGLGSYERFEADGVTVMFPSCIGAAPLELSIELRGRSRRKLTAYWDGCAHAL